MTYLMYSNSNRVSGSLITSTIIHHSCVLMTTKDRVLLLCVVWRFNLPLCLLWGLRCAFSISLCHSASHIFSLHTRLLGWTHLQEAAETVWLDTGTPQTWLVTDAYRCFQVNHISLTGLVCHSCDRDKYSTLHYEVSHEHHCSPDVADCSYWLYDIMLPVQSVIISHYQSFRQWWAIRTFKAFTAIQLRKVQRCTFVCIGQMEFDRSD